MIFGSLSGAEDQGSLLGQVVVISVRVTGTWMVFYLGRSRGGVCQGPGSEGMKPVCTPSTLCSTPSTPCSTPSTLPSAPSTLRSTPSTPCGTPSTLCSTRSTSCSTPRTLRSTTSTDKWGGEWGGSKLLFWNRSFWGSQNPSETHQKSPTRFYRVNTKILDLHISF